MKIKIKGKSNTQTQEIKNTNIWHFLQNVYYIDSEASLKNICDLIKQNSLRIFTQEIEFNLKEKKSLSYICNGSTLKKMFF